MNSISTIITIMKVLEPKELEKRRDHRAKKQKNKRRKWSAAPFVVFVAVTYVVVSLVIPSPPLQAVMAAPKASMTGSVSLPWPGYGQAAIGAVGYGTLAQNGDPKPLPIASVAKIITAVAVLKARPIQPGEQGETITITKDDVATYNRYVAEGQSVIKVEVGEQLTEYQALQAMLLPSANNMAEVLVRWAFGSDSEYLAFVNPFTKTLGMENTVVADASGFSPQTVSTAVDLTKLAEIAMNNPVLAELVAQPQAELPVAGVVYNVNNQLGKNGIVGIKTGNTDEAGGCYMFAATRKIDETNSVTVVGTIMGASERNIAIADSFPLLDTAYKNFKVIKPVETNQIVGKLTQSGGGEVPIIVHQGQPVVSWVSQVPRVDINAHFASSHVAQGDQVGTINVYVGNLTYEMKLIAAESIATHSVFWRLRHAGGYL